MIINKYIFLLNFFQIFFLIGVFFCSKNYIDKFSSEKLKGYNLYFAFILSLVFISVFFGYYYYIFVVNHYFVYILIGFFTICGAYNLGKFILKKSNNLKFKKKIHQIDVFIYLLIFLLFLLSLSPPTDIDSIDYHLGAPINWFNNKGFYPREDWLHYRLIGLGEYINLIGIYFKTFNFGQVIQFFGLLFVIFIGISNLEKKIEKRFFVLLIISCPLILFLTTTQKFQLISSSIIFCNAIYLFNNKKINRLDQFVIVSSLVFITGCKFSYLIPSFLLWIYCALFKIKKNESINFVIISIFSFVIISGFTLYLKNFFYYGDPLSPILENFKNSPDKNLLNFFDYNKTFAVGDINTFNYFVSFFIPLSLGGYTTVLGLSPFFLFLIKVKKINLIEKKILLFIFISSLIIFFSYKGLARYYLEFFFLGSYIICKNYQNLRFKNIFKIYVTIQTVFFSLALFYASFFLTKGIFGKKNWETVLSNNAYGYEISKWVNQEIKGNLESKDIILLSDIRFYSFINAKFLSDQYLKYNDEENTKYEITFFLKGNERIKYILYREKSFVSQYMNSCVSYDLKKDKTFNLKYRNPFNTRKKKIKFSLIKDPKFIC